MPRCFILVLLLFAMILNSQTAFSQALSEAQVDSLAQKVLQVFKVPGLAVGIVKDGKLIYSKGFGVRSLTTGQKVDSQTLFGIASNSKAFTAAAMGILVDEGKIKWDDKVIKYLPGFKLYDAYATKEITIRDLLVHHSGLATGAGDLMHDPDSTTFSLNEIIYNLRYIKPAYSFRSRFAYDNNLYLVAGAVIAKVAKMSWEDFVTDRLLRPLGMNSISASFNGISDKSNSIDAHNQVGGTVKVVTRYTSTIDDAAGGIYANVPDLGKWLLMLLNNGKYGEHLKRQLLSPGTVHDLLAPQVLIPTGGSNIYHTHFAAYGLGWFMVDVKGYKQIVHTGEDVGMVSEVAMLPELGLGVIVLTNSQTNAMDALTYQIIDSYIGVTGVDETANTYSKLVKYDQTNQKAESEVWRKVDSAKNMPVDFKKYSGVYHDKWFGGLTISIRQGRLWFACKRSPQLKGYLYPYQRNTFVVKWQNPEVGGEALVKFDFGKKSVITLEDIAPGMGFNFSDLRFVRAGR